MADPTIHKPLWVRLPGGKVAHAVVDDSLDTVCGLSPEIAEDAPRTKRCVRCLARLREAVNLSEQGALQCRPSSP